MYCRKCGKQLEDDANYCSRCGQAVSGRASRFEPYEEYRERRLQQRRTGVLALVSAYGVLVLAMLAWLAAKQAWEPLRDGLFWLAVLAVLALVAVPVIIFPRLWKKEDEGR